MVLSDVLFPLWANNEAYSCELEVLAVGSGFVFVLAEILSMTAFLPLRIELAFLYIKSADLSCLRGSAFELDNRMVYPLHMCGSEKGLLVSCMASMSIFFFIIKLTTSRILTRE